ncbi:hypothetical protein J3F84DRAFT_385538 [Trichoderma pleuroticola]
MQGPVTENGRVRGTCHVRAKEVVSTVTCKGQGLGTLHVQVCNLSHPSYEVASSNLRRRGFQILGRTACKDDKEDESHKRIQRADGY